MCESEILNFDDERCVEILKNGDLLAFPTDTIYGVGCVFDSFDAFKKMVSLKKRPPEKPFTLMLSDIKQINDFAYVNERIENVINKYLPGEITLILKAKPTYPWVCLNCDTIGIRISGLNKVIDLINKVSKPLLVSSVNESSKPPLNDLISIKEEFEGKIKGIVEYLHYENSSTPSTIVYLYDDQIKLIRQGKISFKDILKTWKGEL